VPGMMVALRWDGPLLGRPQHMERASAPTPSAPRPTMSANCLSGPCRIRNSPVLPRGFLHSLCSPTVWGRDMRWV